MPKYLDVDGVSYLWNKIKNINNQRKITYYSKTKEEWDEDPLFISEKDNLYIYNNYKQIQLETGEKIYFPGLKIGDGKSYLIDLPFFNTSMYEDQIIQHLRNHFIHVSQQDRQFWNNKITAYLDFSNEENLVLSKNAM